jgi:single-strand DNA-binding protein
MNNAQVTITGNCTSDPELKFLDNGSAKLSFSVAADRSWKKGDEWETQTSFFNIIVWRDLAEKAADVLEKGLRVTVVGRLEQRSWEDKESGDKRYAIEVVADEVSISVKGVEAITRRQRTEGGGEKSAPRPQQQRRSSSQERVVPEEAAW